MKTKHLYKHIAALDVAIMPTKILKKTRMYIKLQIAWYNIHGDQLGVCPPWNMGREETIKISKKDLPLWRLYEVRTQK